MRIILCVDMDAFFPSVEQRDNPFYRGKPVVVGADPLKGRGVVSSASYEARKLGIRSGMPITKAYRMAPYAIYVRPRYSIYLAESKKIMGILKEYSPLVEEASIDEAYVDLTGTEKIYGDVENVARTIKKRINDELKLPCTVGIGPNKFIAKLAVELGKPDGFVVVPQDRVLEFISPLTVESVLGIGEKTAQHLHKLGVRTMAELRALPLYLLRHEFGQWGEFLYRIARGEDDSQVVPSRKPKQISSEITLPEDTDDKKRIRAFFYELAKDVGFRLKDEGMFARVVFVKVRYPDFTTKLRSTNFKEPFCGIKAIFDRGWNLIAEMLIGKIRLIGVGVSGLISPAGLPLPLFPDIYSRESELENTIIELKKKFGKEILFLASELESREITGKSQ